MKFPSTLVLLAAWAVPLLATSCTCAPKKQPAPVAATAAGDQPSAGKAVKGGEDDLDEYDPVRIADPLEPLNRVTFWINHQLYTFVFRPISRGYETVFPKPVRKSLDNVVENVRFPIRLVNNTLQGNFKRAGQETGRFFVNSVAGVGGFGRPADHIPSLADVPAADTGQTFAKWGVGNGAYLVLPLLGPSSLRDTVGLAGDYVLNPITWLTFWLGGYDWIIAIPVANTVRSLPDQLDTYDAATKASLDRYLAARSAYIQYRAEAALK